MALKVIGVGFPRTATVSLKKALTKLGFGPCYHMIEITRQPERALDWGKLARGEEVSWEKIFDGYQSACDMPVVNYWRELMDAYPDAKLILTLREPESWFESMSKTLFSDAPNPGRQRMASQPIEVRQALGAMFERSAQQIGEGDKEQCIALYEKHLADVRATVPRERLLEHHPSHGWEPLCKFLGVPTPNEPYPRSNDSTQFGTAWMEDDA